ncbi:MAG: hypothetical protein V1729_06550 [Candidatus Woesearchaeota archaeon]
MRTHWFKDDENLFTRTAKGLFNKFGIIVLIVQAVSFVLLLMLIIYAVKRRFGMV